MNGHCIRPSVGRPAMESWRNAVRFVGAALGLLLAAGCTTASMHTVRIAAAPAPSGPGALRMEVPPGMTNDPAALRNFCEYIQCFLIDSGLLNAQDLQLTFRYGINETGPGLIGNLHEYAEMRGIRESDIQIIGEKRPGALYREVGGGTRTYGVRAKGTMLAAGKKHVYDTYEFDDGILYWSPSGFEGPEKDASLGMLRRIEADALSNASPGTVASAMLNVIEKRRYPKGLMAGKDSLQSPSATILPMDIRRHAVDVLANLPMGPDEWSALPDDFVGRLVALRGKLSPDDPFDRQIQPYLSDVMRRVRDPRTLPDLLESLATITPYPSGLILQALTQYEDDRVLRECAKTLAATDRHGVPPDESTLNVARAYVRKHVKDPASGTTAAWVSAGARQLLHDSLCAVLARPNIRDNPDASYLLRQAMDKPNLAEPSAAAAKLLIATEGRAAAPLVLARWRTELQYSPLTATTAFRSAFEPLCGRQCKTPEDVERWLATAPPPPAEGP